MQGKNDAGGSNNKRNKNEYTILVSRESAKKYLNWKVKSSIKMILNHLDSLSFSSDNHKDEEKHRMLRGTILDALNGLHRAWILLSPIEWFDMSDVFDKNDYDDFVKDLNRKRYSNRNIKH